ncbi:hypothetical protein Tco_1499254 [Tanacetum coccineum]
MRFILKTKVDDLVIDDDWRWPGDWNDRFQELMEITVPNLIENLEDKERNLRLFGANGRSDEEIFKIVFESVRLRIMGLKLKVTSEMIILDHMYFAEQRGVWCSSLSLIDKWPYRADDRLTSRKLGLLKSGWCCSDLISLALCSLESFNLIVTSAGFLSLGMNVKLLSMMVKYWSV